MKRIGCGMKNMMKMLKKESIKSLYLVSVKLQGYWGNISKNGKVLILLAFMRSMQTQEVSLR